ncbi:cytochrome P450 [Nocardia sp. NEAU-G5]|uniref:Cytochrome P450 n=1 Tax=Nocardia albiluteola TaxID=2842303 RepID=A0ABS6ASL1_9NOCA|nr:cytochrome P450 [Nocardia albiluteola]MBU3061024.1 cytochrome P450 [Nocardia albiluteola]
MHVITQPGEAREVLTECPVPSVDREPAGVGMRWLRAHVARFSDGVDHARRRARAVAELDTVSPTVLRQRASELADQPHRLLAVRVLAEALGFSSIDLELVAEVAAAYQPHNPAGPNADRAVAGLVAACGGVADERTAARIGLLVQACQATDALVTAALERRPSSSPEEAVAETLRVDPPVRRTRRIYRGELVEVDLAGTGLGFGAGPHECPGRDHAIAIATGIVTGRR